jgi:hypothetical protein
MKKIVGLKIVSLLKLFILFVVVLSFSCTNSVSENTEETHSESYQNISSINNNYVPTSLKSNSNASYGAVLSYLATPGASQFSNFLDLQPALLKSYIEMTRVFLEELVNTVDETEDVLSLASLNTSGNFIFDDSDVVSWSKSSDEEWELSIKDPEDNSQILFLSVNQSEYLIDMDSSFINEDDEDSFGSYTATINYTNNDSWLAEILVTDIGLENGDRDTPERIKLYIQYEDDIWKGKVMTYHPYADNPPLAPSMNIYTDFIANDDVVKANIYFIDDAQDSLLNLSDYAVGRVKENYPAFSGVSYATSHPNPLVMLANSSTWGSDGLASLTEIANSNYLSDTLWITPFDFKNLSDLNVR